MQVLLNPFFWVAAFALYPLQYLPLGLRRSVYFGLCNLFILWVLLGTLYLVVAAGLTGAVWYTGDVLRRLRDRGDVRPQRYLATGALIATCLGLGLYKLLKDYPEITRVLCPEDGCSGSIVLGAFAALSFSYASLRCIDFVLSVWHGSETTDPLSLFGYLFPFHMLVAGPICLYDEFLTINEGSPPQVKFSRFIEVVNLITTGLFYKFVVAELLRIYGFGISGALVVESWLDSALLLVYLFFDFAGYSLVALGIGRLCHVPTPENFRAPFSSRSVTEFFTRWHMSLGEFIRRNVFLPLQVRFVRQWGVSSAGLVALGTMSTSFVVVGLWHRLTPAFFVWGLFLGTVMGIEKIVQQRFLSSPLARAQWPHRLGIVLGPVYVFCAVTTSIHLVADQVFRG